ncbi:unnamed protein product [Prunus armeniaca]
MWLGNEPSNWGTNSQPARTAETLKTRTPVTSPTRANYPVKGPRTLVQGRPSANISTIFPASHNSRICDQESPHA